MTQALDQFLTRAEALLTRLEAWLPRPAAEPDWQASVAWRARRQQGQLELEPVLGLSPIRLNEILEVDAQKERLVRNVAQFVAGRPANHVLLSGAKGTGKSSLVKAVLNEFAPQGLRLIEVDKAELTELPTLVRLIAARPERYLVYCDDLSFEDGEPAYKALKSVLDGSVAAVGERVLIIATSNRRHLLPEKMADNLGGSRGAQGEIHPGEAVEEKISLSERFGLWISFYPFSQDEYLAIAAQWLAHYGLSPAQIEAARPEALVWALERGSRSGRVAHQFARDHAGRRAVSVAGDQA